MRHGVTIKLATVIIATGVPPTVRFVIGIFIRRRGCVIIVRIIPYFITAATMEQDIVMIASKQCLIVISATETQQIAPNALARTISMKD